MGSSNFSEDKSSKELQERLAAEAEANGGPIDNNVPAAEPPTTKKSLGYVDGYAQYIERYGGEVEIDGEKVRSSEVINSNATQQEKPQPFSKQVNTQINKFRNIFGYELWGFYTF
jgi:hypothetical protein